jgi:hypothetical protein
MKIQKSKRKYYEASVFTGKKRLDLGHTELKLHSEEF